MKEYKYLSDILNELKTAKNSLKMENVILLPFDVVYLNNLGWEILPAQNEIIFIKTKVV